MYNLKSSRDIGFFLREGEGTATKIIEGAQNVFFFLIELGAQHGCTEPKINTSK